MILVGNCLDRLKELKDNSVDSIVTDPPYHLTSIVKRFGKEGSAPAKPGKDGSFGRLSGGFMGKTWDGLGEDGLGIAFNPDMWSECLRVLKPGGHLLAFSGTRTYHRMAVAIEDAGFEIRDMVEWVYGCLSEDTEILTENGYKPLHKLTQYDRIGVYDITNNIYKWERPQRWSVYKVHQDTAYRIKSDCTDQIVSRNHRCLVEREGKLVFIQADELNEMEYMPTLSEDFYSLQKNSNRKLLLKELLWKGKRLAQKVFSKWTGNKKSEERIEVRKEPSLERWSNLLEETRKLQADKICEVSEGVFTDGEKRWICNGTSFDNGSILGDMFRENPSSASYQSRPTGQPTGKPDVISIKQGTQITRRARVTKIEYSGIIFCPTVSTGAFIARRNGQVFITGNSGFPKSLNIGKKVDELQGNEREELGLYKTSRPVEGVNGQWQIKDRKNGKGSGFKGGSVMATKGNSAWEGWGTALKPAHEPICLARKPIEGTVAANVLKYGTGGLNIDKSRVWTQDNLNGGIYSGEGKCKTVADHQWGFTKQDGKYVQPTGRFPANFLHDGSDEVVGLFPNTKGSIGRANRKTAGDYNASSYKVGVVTDTEIKDDGSAARFFKSFLYCPKASRSERNNGLDSTVLVDIISVWKDNNTTKEEKLIRLLVTGLSLQKVIVESGTLQKKGNEWSMFLFGKELTERYQADTGYTTKTETNSTTPSEILNYLTHSLTSGYIQDANLEMVSGGNHAESVENSKTLTITISEAMASALGVKNAQSPTQLLINVREGSNFHSTVKPLALMKYLIQMITPEGGVVLDPFAGSGSTLVAAKELGYDFIGIEMTEEYIPIIEARLSAVKNIQESLI